MFRMGNQVRECRRRLHLSKEKGECGNRGTIIWGGRRNGDEKRGMGEKIERAS